MIRRALAALAWASVLLTATACAGTAQGTRRPANDGTRPSAQEPQPRVMPLGDSITDGLQTLGGYRGDLWQYMRADGVAPDFVGSRSSGPPQLGDHDDEGHPSWRIGQLAAHVRTWLEVYRPDTVLLHIGTNDVIQGGVQARRAPARLAGLLGLITTTRPAAQVYVATIIPLGNPVAEIRARAYNATIPGIVAREAARGRHVHLVEMHDALTMADLSADGIHPTDGGYSKMAARWYAALTGAPMTRWEAEGPAYTSVNNGERLETTAASGNGKVGYLTAPGSYLEFAVRVPAAGTYRIYVRAADGMGRPCAQRLTVDGVAQTPLRYEDFGWNRWTITAARIGLRAGPNTIRLAHGICAAEVDAIDLAPAR